MNWKLIVCSLITTRTKHTVNLNHRP